MLIASSLARSKKQFLIVMLLLPFNNKGFPEMSTNLKFSITTFDWPDKFFAPDVGNDKYATVPVVGVVGAGAVTVSVGVVGVSVGVVRRLLLYSASSLLQLVINAALKASASTALPLNDIGFSFISIEFSPRLPTSVPLTLN